MSSTTKDAEKDDRVSTPEVLCGLEVGDIDSNVSHAQFQRVLFKIDLVVMPLIVVAMTLAFLDKVFAHLDNLNGQETRTNPVDRMA